MIFNANDPAGFHTTDWASLNGTETGSVAAYSTTLEFAPRTTSIDTNENVPKARWNGVELCGQVALSHLWNLEVEDFRDRSQGLLRLASLDLFKCFGDASTSCTQGFIRFCSFCSRIFSSVGVLIFTLMTHHLFQFIEFSIKRKQHVFNIKKSLIKILHIKGIITKTKSSSITRIWPLFSIIIIQIWRVVYLAHKPQSERWGNSGLICFSVHSYIRISE